MGRITILNHLKESHNEKYIYRNALRIRPRIEENLMKNFKIDSRKNSPNKSTETNKILTEKFGYSSECVKCRKIFSSIYALRRHMVEIHDGKKYHKCKICMIVSNSEIDLKMHLKEKHNQSMTPQNTCRVRGYRYFSKSPE